MNFELDKDICTGCSEETYVLLMTGRCIKCQRKEDKKNREAGEEC